MNVQDFAKRLNGREYGDEISTTEEQVAKENKLLIIFGYSDDCVELRGVIDEEFTGGTTIIFGRKGETIFIDTDTDDIGGYEGFDGVFKRCKKLEAIQVDECSVEPESYVSSEHGINGWEFKTDLHHAEFFIYEDEELYGKGLVIDMSDFL